MPEETPENAPAGDRPVPMPTFGENLRREREMRGVTLEEISESTKISTRLLKAIETEQFSELPGGIFTRNFIRAYAQYLGLDEEHALAEYKRAAGSPSDNDLTRLAPNKTLTSMTGPRGRLVPWVVIAVLLGSGYAVYRYSHRTITIPPVVQQAQQQTTAAPSTPSAPASSPASTSASNPSAANPGAPGTPGNSPAQSAQQTTPRSSAAGTNPTTAAGAAPGAANAAASAPELGEGDLVLQVSTTEQVWLAVAADGKTLWQHLMPANSTRLFRARDSFDVTTGNAEGTSLTLNGQAQKPLGREGEFKRVHLTRDGLQAQAPSRRAP
ncbi:MAG TPA: RodZ domain-containing protein [Terriglobia bacterium]|nr:RodZ domain-containing protein [Terriglobia bacterium]